MWNRALIGVGAMLPFVILAVLAGRAASCNFRTWRQVRGKSPLVEGELLELPPMASFDVPKGWPDPQTLVVVQTAQGYRQLAQDKGETCSLVAEMTLVFAAALVAVSLPEYAHHAFPPGVIVGGLAALAGLFIRGRASSYWAQIETLYARQARTLTERRPDPSPARSWFQFWRHAGDRAPRVKAGLPGPATRMAVGRASQGPSGAQELKNQ